MNKRLGKNILYNTTYQLLVYILPFITAPYLSRYLGVEGIGVYSFNQSIAMYFVYFAVLGLSNYGNRMIASVQDNEELRSKAFFEIYFMQIITAVCSIMLYVLYIVLFSKNQLASVIMMMWVVSALFDINWFFFGMELFKITIVRNTLIKVLSVVLILAFVKSPDDVYIYLAIMSACTLLSQIVLWPYLKRYVRIIIPSWVDIKKHFKPNIRLFIPIIASSIYNVLDKVMLGAMIDMTEVGYYENSEKLIKMIQSLIIAVGTVMLPRMSNIYATNQEDDKERYFDIAMNIVMIYCSAAIFGILASGSKFINLYYGSGYEKSSVLLNYLIITVFFFGVGNVLRTQYLIPSKKDNVFIISSLIGSVLNVVFNMILIPFWGAIGASIATIASEVSVCFYQFYMSRNTIRVKKYIIPFLIYTLTGVVMLISIRACPSLSSPIADFIKDVIIGVLIYGLLVILITNKLKCTWVKQ